MRFDLDCVRAILLEVEKIHLRESQNVEKLHVVLPEFSEDDITYCCLKLEEAGFLDLTTVVIPRQLHPGIKTINGLTYDGHQFLEKIRNDSIWIQTKGKAKIVGSFALDVVSQIAASIISSRIGL